MWNITRVQAPLPSQPPPGSACWPCSSPSTAPPACPRSSPCSSTSSSSGGCGASRTAPGEEVLPVLPALLCSGSWPVSQVALWTAPPWPPCTARATPPGSSSTGPSRWGRLGTPCTPGHRGSEAAYPGPLREIPRGPEVTSSPPALLGQADGPPGEGALLLAGAGGGGGGGDREDAQEGGSSACNSSFRGDLFKAVISQLDFF